MLDAGVVMKYFVILIKLKIWLKNELKYYNPNSLDYKILRQVRNKIRQLEGGKQNE